MEDYTQAGIEEEKHAQYYGTQVSECSLVQHFCLLHLRKWAKMSRESVNVCFARCYFAADVCNMGSQSELCKVLFPAFVIVSLGERKLDWAISEVC